MSSNKKCLLIKYSVADLVKSGYEGHVFAPVSDNMADMPEGVVAASLSWSQKTIRTIQQNKAMYKYFSLIAEKMEAAGIDLQMLMRTKKVSVPVTATIVKETVWSPVMKAMFGHESTSRMDVKEVTRVHQVVDRHMAENFNVSSPFPDSTPQFYENENYCKK